MSVCLRRGWCRRVSEEGLVSACVGGGVGVGVCVRRGWFRCV